MEEVKVFIVEDDPMVALINKRFVEKLPPFKVVGVASTEEEALKTIHTMKPDLVLLDIYLPQGDGLTLLKQIRYSGLPIDVILVTAAKDSATIYESLRFGAVDYLIKPFDFERLQQALNNYLKLRQLISKNTDLSQEDLDKLNMFGEEEGQGEGEGQREEEKSLSDLPKGVHLLTLEQILSFLLKQDKALSCQQIASALNMSKITVWRYLEYLANSGKLKVDLVYGPVGRPTKQYRVGS